MKRTVENNQKCKSADNKTELCLKLIKTVKSYLDKYIARRQKGGKYNKRTKPVKLLKIQKFKKAPKLKVYKRKK